VGLGLRSALRGWTPDFGGYIPRLQNLAYKVGKWLQLQSIIHRTNGVNPQELDLAYPLIRSGISTLIPVDFESIQT